MFLIVELLFIVLLTAILFMIYRNEHLFKKKFMPQASVKEYWAGKERRQHVRFKKDLEVNYTVTKKPHLKNNCKTIDISEGGMKLILCEKLSPGVILNFQIDIPDSKEKAEIEGVVVWAEDAIEDKPSNKRFFHAGIKFCAIKEPDSAPFVNYIRSIAKELAV